MIILKKDYYQVIGRLVNENNSHLPLLKSILSETKSGYVFVDALDQPSVAAILSEEGWFYLLGNENNQQFNHNLQDFLIEKVNDKKNMIWFGISEAWIRKLQSCNLLKIENYKRIQYKFNHDKFQARKMEIPPYALETIHKDNLSKVFEYDDDMKIFWENEDNFLKKGFGFILLDQEKIIGHAISAAVEDGQVEIDVQTSKAYRGNNIAGYLCQCMIEACIKKSLIPKWDCFEANVPSNKLALKLGFTEVKKYSLALLLEQEQSKTN